MKRTAPRNGGDLHARFRAWLVDGVPGDPPRDVALHAAYCPGCRTSMAAFDALTEIDTGGATAPAAWSAAAMARRGLFSAARAGVATIALVVLAAGGGLAASGVLESRSGIAAPSTTPVQQVLGGALRTESAGASMGQSLDATPSGSATDGASAAPSIGSAFPAAPAPAAGPTAEPPASSSPRTTATARPSVRASSTAAATVAPTAAPTPPPSAAPTPVRDDCEDGIDNDGDTLIDIEDPGCPLDGNEASA